MSQGERKSVLKLVGCNEAEDMLAVDGAASAIHRSRPASAPDEGALAGRSDCHPAAGMLTAALAGKELPRLQRFFLRRVGSLQEAQDLTQDVAARFARAEPVAEMRSVSAYLRQIAVNLLRDRARSGSARLEKLTVPYVEGLGGESEFDPHRILAAREELRVWDGILSKLKPRTLEIFLLSRVDGHSYKKIAARLDMTVWNVKRHMIVAIRHVERHRRRL